MDNRNGLNSMDILNIISFYIGLLNYGENFTQTDKQELLETMSGQTSAILSEIQAHLKIQDEKIDQILEVLGYDSK